MYARGVLKFPVALLSLLMALSASAHEDTLTGYDPGNAATEAKTTGNDTLYRQISEEYLKTLANVDRQKTKPLTQVGRGSQVGEVRQGAGANANPGPVKLQMGAVDSNAANNAIGKGGGSDPVDRQQVSANNRNMTTTDKRKAFDGPDCELAIAPNGATTVRVPKTGLNVTLPLQSFASTQQNWAKTVNYKFRDVSGPFSKGGISAGATTTGSILSVGGNTLPLERWGVTDDLSDYYYGPQDLVAQADQLKGYGKVKPGKILLRVGLDSEGKSTCSVIGGAAAGGNNGDGNGDKDKDKGKDDNAVAGKQDVDKAKALTDKPKDKKT